MHTTSPAYERAIARVQECLAHRYAAGFTPDEVAEVVARGRRQLEESGRHREFIPALLEHWARDELLATAQAQGRAQSPVPKVLFVCEHGEGRSQVAAALTEHLSGRRVLVRSAGLHPTGRLNPHAAEVLAERGIELRDPLPCEVHDDALDAADVIVLIGCRSSDTDLVGHRVVRWHVDDPYAQDLATARRIAEELEARVVDLLTELEIPVAPGTRVSAAP